MGLVPKSRASLVRICILLLWAVLFGGLLRRELFISTIAPSELQVLQQAEREEYQGIYFRDRKIGYVSNHYVPGEGNSLNVDQKAHMNLNVGEVIHQIDLHLRAELHADNTLDTFSFTFESPFYQMSASGYVENNRIHFTLTTGSNTISDSLPVDGPPMVSTARRGYLLRGGMEQGSKMKVPWFDPVSLTAKSSVVEYRGMERIQISGRVHNLHRFTENLGGTRVNLWLNDQGNVMKEESPAGFVFIREPKFKALSLTETSDELLSAAAVKITGSMPELEGRGFMRYRLTLPDVEGFVLNSGRQQFDGSILKINRESLPQPSMMPAVPGCADIDTSLDATPYIQSDAKPIANLTAEVLNGKESEVERIRKLANWIYRNLEKRPVLGIPDALTTLDNLRGDCNEHAALFAALARNAGIPTRIAAGVVFHRGAFYYHAWNEVCAGGQWLTIDTTTNEFPADLSHIKFVQGELDAQVRIGALIGRLAIEPLVEETEDVK